MGRAFLVRRGGGSSGGGMELLALRSFDERPARPKEGAVAIVTEGSVGGISIRAAAPPEAEEGMVYFSLSRPDGDIKIGESIRISVSGAHVRRENTWRFADTYLYRDGVWYFLWSGQLYSTGAGHAEGVIDNEYTAYTGGFAVRAAKAANDASASAVAPVLTREEDGMTADSTESGNVGAGMLYTVGMIDLTPYKSVVFEGEFERGYTIIRNFTAAVWSKLGTYYMNNVLAYTQMPENTGSRIEVDVSAVNESAYVGIGLTYSKAKITRAYLVPKDV